MNRIRGSRCIYVFPFSITHSCATNNWKPLYHEISHKRENYGLTKYIRTKVWTYKTPTRKNFGPRKYPQEKFWSHKIPTRKKFSTHKRSTAKKIGTHEIPKKTWCHDTARPRRPKMVHGFYYKYVYWNLVMLEFTCKNDQLKHGMSYYHVHRIKVSIKAFSITNSCCLKRQCW